MAAENLPASALIVVNKIDLNNDNVAVSKIKDKYNALPYEVVEISTMLEDSPQKLLQYLKLKTCIFVGQSGVGKSTIIDSLIPEIQLETQNISDNINQGKHTTSTTTLYDLPLGGELIDSPGVRKFSLPELDEEKIKLGFYEIKNIGEICKFHNCKHLNEPNCAIRTAVDQGNIHSERYASYKNMIESLKIEY